MNRYEGWSWLCAHFGESKAKSIVHMCVDHPDKLEAIATTQFHASDPRRQQLRISIRTIMESENK